MMQIALYLDHEPDDEMSMARIVREALRGRAHEYEILAHGHEENGATMAALMYLRRALTLRSLIDNELSGF